MNGVILGTWTSPGDYGDRRGKYNPSWWFSFLNQYGLLKKLTITPEGTFLDAEKLSDVSTRQLALTDQSVMKFRFSVLPGAKHPGGCTLFGAGFGDYNQHIPAGVLFLVQVSEIITSIYGLPSVIIPKTSDFSA